MTKRNSSSVMPQVIDGPGVKKELGLILQDTKAEFFGISSPFIKEEPTKTLIRRFKNSQSKKEEPELRILVSLELENFVKGASDVEAIDAIIAFQSNFHRKVLLRHLPRLHAKIYTSNINAIIGSANLTNSGLGGGNFESAVLLKRQSEVKAASHEFDKLWGQGRIVTRKLWEERSEQIKKLKHTYKKTLEKIRQLDKDICNFRTVLVRIPSTKVNEQANYYAELIRCLEWIQEPSQKSRTEGSLISYLRQTSGTSINALKRCDFMKSNGLIAKGRSRWRVTMVGKSLQNDPDSRWRTYSMLLSWCEEIGDEQFRVLLHGIEVNIGRNSSLITIRDLYNIIPRQEKQRWWDEESYERFREYSCPARNWLVSLGILKAGNEGHDTAYSRGDIYDRISPIGTKRWPLDTRLNKVIEDASL